jgi:trehalose 6-phosphate phosphatase
MRNKEGTIFPALKNDMIARRMVSSGGRITATRSHAQKRRLPRSVFQAWPEIIARLRAAKHRALLLDFDGTLANLRRRPADVRLSARTRDVLARLPRLRDLFVAIVSGRRVRDLRARVGTKGIHYFGLYGSERLGRSLRLSKSAKSALRLAKRVAQSLPALYPGVWIEDKGPSFAVHHRGARPEVALAAHESLFALLASWTHALHVFNGDNVWEVLPREIPGKDAAVKTILKKLPRGSLVIYVGNDATDEAAFAVLVNQITVRVGKRHGTQAQFYLRTPADVLHFLARLERELS